MADVGLKREQADICFGRWRLSPASRRLFADGTPVTLRGRAFDLLLTLVEAKGDIVTKEALMRRVWPGAIVDDNSLQVQISALRKVLGQDAALLITTVPRRGYCFTCKWQWMEAAAIATTADEAPGTPSERPSPIVLPFRSLGDETGQDVATTILKATPPRPATDRPVVAVLPFDNIGSDADQTYFVDGLTVDLVTDLSRFQSLHVVGPPRRSEWSGPVLPTPPGIDAPPRAAAYLVSGNVRRTDARIRVTAQLEDAQSGVVLWSERFDRSLEDLFAVQEDLSQRIAGVLVANIESEGLGRAKRRPPLSRTPMSYASAVANFITRAAKPEPWPLARCSTARLPPIPTMPRPMP
jgi:TolB-like protein